MSLAEDMHWRPSPNFDVRLAPIRFIVIHYTGMVSAEQAMERLSNPDSKVSCHYFIDADGQITKMVEDMDRAWHAGAGRYRETTDLNSSSIGIELHNPGHEWGYVPFPDAQMRSCVRLVATLCARYRIDRANVIGHSDLAPTRKEDPGELFDWSLLARHRIALARPETPLLPDPLWPDAAFALALERFGYDISDLEAATRAFQRRFRQNRPDGIVDGETRAILLTLQVLEEARLQGSEG